MSACPFTRHATFGKLFKFTQRNPRHTIGGLDNRGHPPREPFCVPHLIFGCLISLNNWAPLWGSDNAVSDNIYMQICLGWRGAAGSRVHARLSHRDHTEDLRSGPGPIRETLSGAAAVHKEQESGKMWGNVVSRYVS